MKWLAYTYVTTIEVFLMNNTLLTSCMKVYMDSVTKMITITLFSSKIWGKFSG